MYELPHTTTIRRRLAGRVQRNRLVLERLRCEQGQALVEFALVLPVLLLVVVGIVTFGRAMNYDSQETHLVNEAARYAAVDQVPAGATGTLGQWVRGQI